MEYEPVYIYALTDPRNDEVRYVGKSIDPERRYISHLFDKETNAGKVAWIERLESRGLKPGMKILEEADESNWSERESWWIKHGLDEGWKLLNISMGGEGGSIYQLPSSLYSVLPKDVINKLESLPSKVQADIIVDTAKLMADGFLEMVRCFINDDMDGYYAYQESGRRIAINTIPGLIEAKTRLSNKES